ncbi:unnamed protein product, partial [Discosporangium mesarthrocarpum]
VVVESEEDLQAARVYAIYQGLLAGRKQVPSGNRFPLARVGVLHAASNARQRLPPFLRGKPGKPSSNTVALLFCLARRECGTSAAGGCLLVQTNVEEGCRVALENDQSIL